MLTQLQLWTRRSTSCVLLAAFMTLMSFLADTFKRVVFDPTTYAPAVAAYDATMRDWNSSQPFFQNGYFEPVASHRAPSDGTPRQRPHTFAGDVARLATGYGSACAGM